MAAISGLRELRCAMPAQPRPSTKGLSPATNALRSMPAQNDPPAPVSTPTLSSSSPSSSSRAAATPCASALLTALRAWGRLRVISSTPARRSVSTGSSLMAGTLRAKQSQGGLALAAQLRQIHLDPRKPPRLGQHARLRLHDLGGQHAVALGHRGVQPDALQVARELLDRLDRPDPLDLDRHPAVPRVAAHQVDGPDVGRPLAAHEPEALAAALRRGGERLLQVGL